MDDGHDPNNRNLGSDWDSETASLFSRHQQGRDEGGHQWVMRQNVSRQELGNLNRTDPMRQSNRSLMTSASDSMTTLNEEISPSAPESDLPEYQHTPPRINTPAIRSGPVKEYVKLRITEDTKMDLEKQ